MITYYETNNVDVNEVLTSWVMTKEEKESIVNRYRTGPHKYMPTFESLLNNERHDLEDLNKLLLMNNTFYVIKKDQKIISIATVINYNNEKVLVYLLPFRYYTSKMIYDVLLEIKDKNNASSIKSLSDLDSEYDFKDIRLPKIEYNPTEVELDNIKRSINYLLNNGLSEDLIISEIIEYLNSKSYHK